MFGSHPVWLRGLLAAAVWFAFPGDSVLGQDDPPDAPLVEPIDGLARYEITGIRMGPINEVKRRPVMIDWRRTKPGFGRPMMAVRDGDGRGVLTEGVFARVLRDESGTIEFGGSFGFGFLEEPDLEAMIVSPGPGDPRDAEFDVLVSNIVTLGTPPQPASRAVAMTAAQRADFETLIKRTTPPQTLPAGWVRTDPQTPLADGMVAKWGRNMEWFDAEILDVHSDGFTTDRGVTLKMDSDGKITVGNRGDFLAVRSVDVAKARTNPKAFSPSVRVFPDSIEPMPDGYVVVGDTALVVGTPVKASRTVNPIDARIESSLGNGTYNVIYDDTGNRDTFKGIDLAITTQTLETLRGPDPAKAFAAVMEKKAEEKKRAEAAEAMAAEQKRAETYAPISQAAADRLDLDEYPIGGKIPRDAQVVPDDLPVPAGTDLGVWRTARWQKLICVAGSQSGPIAVAWEGASRVWDVRIAREDLIIAKREVAKLRRLAASGELDLNAEMEAIEKAEAAAEKQAAAEIYEAEPVRLWRSADRKFTVQAKLTGRKDGMVFLETREGEELEVPYDQLGTHSQHYLGIVERRIENAIRRR